jgi:hypothetical protein
VVLLLGLMPQNRGLLPRLRYQAELHMRWSPVGLLSVMLLLLLLSRG